jgi:hypothetical protein
MTQESEAEAGITTCEIMNYMFFFLHLAHVCEPTLNTDEARQKGLWTCFALPKKKKDPSINMENGAAIYLHIDIYSEWNQGIFFWQTSHTCLWWPNFLVFTK